MLSAWTNMGATARLTLSNGTRQRSMTLPQHSYLFSMSETIQEGGLSKVLCVKGGADISRKGIEDYTTFVGRLGIKGLAWMKMQEGKLSSNIVKFFPDELQKELIALDN